MSKKDEETRSKIDHDLSSLTIVTDESEKESGNDKVLRLLLEKKDINLKTELNDKEILEISKLEVVSKQIDSETLLMFLSTFKELRVSKDRKGRSELIGAIQDESTKRGSGFFDQFMDGIVGRK